MAHRIQRHEVCDVLPGGVRQHGYRVRTGNDPVPWRLERTDGWTVVASNGASHGMVRVEDRSVSLRVYADPRDNPAYPLRPAHVHWMESPASARAGEYPGDELLRGGPMIQ